jgi:hypothetical protein
MNRRPLPLAHLLPLAAEVKIAAAAHGPMRLLDRAIQEVQQQYPQYFQLKENHHETETQ